MSEVRYRSETIRIQITVKVNGTVVNLNDYSGIIFMIYFGSNQILAQFSRDVLTGYDNTNFKVIDAANGRFDILIQSSVSLPANIDDVYGEIQMQKTDSDWTNNQWRRIASGISLFKFKDAQSKNVGAA